MIRRGWLLRYTAWPQGHVKGLGARRESDSDLDGLRHHRLMAVRAAWLSPLAAVAASPGGGSAGRARRAGRGSSSLGGPCWGSTQIRREPAIRVCCIWSTVCGQQVESLGAVVGGGAGVGPDGVEAGVAEHLGDGDQVGAAADESSSAARVLLIVVGARLATVSRWVR
ncbi:MAG: hypothetical protein JO249_07305 [Acidobacteria bacterium]|nr:hypothetical protein [Acidobacteriota bacterium]